MVAHAGGAGLRLLADRSGLTGALSKALARRGFNPGHDRGRVLVDVAVMLAGNGEAIADIDVLRHQSQMLGPVTSSRRPTSRPNWLLASLTADLSISPIATLAPKSWVAPRGVV